MTKTLILAASFAAMATAALAAAPNMKMLDPDGDGTLDAKELSSSTGKTLVSMIQ